MLPGEAVVFAVDGEAEGEPFFADLGFGHFVFWLDGDGGVFAAEFDEGDAAGGFEGGVDGFDLVFGVAEFVVDVDEEDEVAGGGGEFGVVEFAEDGFDVGDVAGLGAGGEHVEHLGLDIDGEDGAFFAGELGHGEGVVAVAAAEVADGPAGLDAEFLEHEGGVFLLFAVLAHEPFGAGPVHGLGDGAALVFGEGRRGRGGGGEEEGEEEERAQQFHEGKTRGGGDGGQELS